MNSRRAAAMALTTVLLIDSRCASVEGADTKQPTQPAELIYRTGSNIPVRDKTPMTAEEKAKQAEDAQRTLRQMQTTGAGAPKL